MIENFLITYHQNLELESFEQKGKRSFLKPEEKLKLVLGVNRLLKRKVPYKRRNYSKTTMIRTIIKEEPLKLAQYPRHMSPWLAFLKTLPAPISLGVKL